MRFFHPAGRGSAFPGSFSGQLFAGRFPTRGLTSSLLGSGHFLLPAGDTRDSGAATLASRGETASVQRAGRPARLPSRLPAPHGGRQMAEGRRLPWEGGRGEESLPLLDGRRPSCREPGVGTSESPAGKRRRRGSGAKPQGKTTRPQSRQQQSEQPAPAGTQLPTVVARGINGRQGLKPQAKPRLTQQRSLRPLPPPPCRSRRPMKSRSRRTKARSNSNERPNRSALQAPPKPPLLYPRFTLRLCVIGP